MCLGVPGRISKWLDRDPLFTRAVVEFDGVGLECHMACVPDASIGDYVIVHAGVAICQVDELEAQCTLAELRRLDLIDPLPEDCDQRLAGGGA